MKSDEICARYSEKGVNLVVKLLNKEDILIEGDSTSLSFLGELILAHVEEHGDGRNISPHGQGSVFFGPNSQFGLYIHRVASE